MSASARLSDWCLRAITPPVQQQAVEHVLDWLGCAAIGASVPAANILWQATALPAATVTQPHDPWRTLLYEASLGNIFELDDVHKQALVHPGSVVIPASLFLARQLGSSGTEILQAVVRGYEAMCRFGRALGPAHYEKLHNTATCGAVGAAAAACALLKLDKNTWVAALGLAATQSAGLWQVRIEPGMGKQWHLARVAQTGVQAALYARAGVTAPKLVFEGAKGYFAAHCPDGDLAQMWLAHEHDWQIAATSFKPWPACRHTHAAIDAALLLRAQIIASRVDMAAENTIERLFKEIKVYTYQDALDFCDQPRPDTPLAARFSLQHAVATALGSGAPVLADFDQQALNQPAIAALRDKVRVSADQDINQSYPDHFAARVVALLVDGSTCQAQVDDAWGDPEWPMNAQQVEDKARGLMAAADWPQARIDRQIAACKLLFTSPQQASVIASVAPVQ